MSPPESAADVHRPHERDISRRWAVSLPSRRASRADQIRSACIELKVDIFEMSNGAMRLVGRGVDVITSDLAYVAMSDMQPFDEEDAQRQAFFRNKPIHQR